MSRGESTSSTITEGSRAASTVLVLSMEYVTVEVVVLVVVFLGDVSDSDISVTGAGVDGTTGVVSVDAAPDEVSSCVEAVSVVFVDAFWVVL